MLVLLQEVFIVLVESKSEMHKWQTIVFASVIGTVLLAALISVIYVASTYTNDASPTNIEAPAVIGNSIPINLGSNPPTAPQPLFNYTSLTQTVACGRVNLSNATMFSSSTTLLLPIGTTQIWATLVGGGGGGGNAPFPSISGGGGGGSGSVVLCYRINVTQLDNISITIGAGGLFNQRGGNTVVQFGSSSVTAYGGGAGGAGSSLQGYPNGGGGGGGGGGTTQVGENAPASPSAPSTQNRGGIGGLNQGGAGGAGGFYWGSVKSATNGSMGYFYDTQFIGGCGGGGGASLQSVTGGNGAPMLLGYSGGLGVGFGGGGGGGFLGPGADGGKSARPNTGAGGGGMNTPWFPEGTGGSGAVIIYF